MPLKLGSQDVTLKLGSQDVTAYLGAEVVSLDPDAAAYLAAVEEADGESLEPAVREAIADFVVGCKSDGIWDALDQCCILAGARTLAGALVPLKGTAPTNNNFVSGDYNRETGLQGNGSNKNLVLATSSDTYAASESGHAALFIQSITALGGWALNSSNTYIVPAVSAVAMRHFIASGFDFGSALSPPSFVGLNRTVDQRESRANGTTVSGAVSGFSSSSTAYRVFSRDTDGNVFNGRMSFYSVGFALNLESLDTRVSALVTAIGAAI